MIGEQLQAKSDKELDLMSGLDVMGWTELAGRFYREKFNYSESGDLVCSVTDWNPTTDMNDAKDLLKKYRYAELKWDHSFGWVSIIEGNTSFDQSPSKAITIAAILAKYQQ